MAERITISEINFEEGPAGRAIVRLQQQMDALQARMGTSSRTIRTDWDRTGNAFVSRMFSMRQAAQALLGGITVGGLIFAIKNLAEEVIRSSESFKELERAAGNVNREFLALARATLDVNHGVEEATTWMDRLAGAMRAATEAQTQHPAAASAAKQGLLGMLFFGIPGASALLGNLKSIGFAVDQIIPKQIEAAKLAGLTSFVPPGSRADIIDPIALAAKAKKPPDRAVKIFSELNVLVREAIPLWEQASRIDPFALMADSVDELTEQADQMREAADVMADLIQQAKEATIQFQVMQMTIATGADLIANALAGNVQSYRAFIRSILIEMARMFIVEGLGNLAKGWAALGTVFGSAVAHFYFRAAAMDFAAAGAAGLASRAVGGGGGAGGGPRRSAAGNEFVNQQGGAPSHNITVVIEGNASADTVDAIIHAISTRLKDGVSGGNFNGQLARA